MVQWPSAPRNTKPSAPRNALGVGGCQHAGEEDPVLRLDGGSREEMVRAIAHPLKSKLIDFCMLVQAGKREAVDGRRVDAQKEGAI